MTEVDITCKKCSSKRITIFQDTIMVEGWVYRIFCRCLDCNDEKLIFQWTQNNAYFNKNI